VETHELDLKHTLRVLWRRKMIVAVSLVLVTGGAVFASIRQTPQYSSSATIVIRPLVAPLSVGGQSGGDAGPLGLELSTESEAQILKSSTIAARVKRTLGLSASTESLLRSVEVDIVTDEVLKVTAHSPVRKQAAQLADTFATEYVENRRDLATERLASVAAELRQRLDAVSARAGELDAQIVAQSSGPDAASHKSEVGRLTAERDGLIYQIGALRGRYEDVRSTEAGSGGGDVVQTATIPRSPSSPKPIRDGAVGLVLGSLLGVGLALLRERLDDRIRTGSEAARVAGIPVIATLPRVDNPSDVLASFANPNSPGAEGHRTLRQSLAAMGLGAGLRTILITSEDVAAGKTTVAANLGVACALAGMRTIVVSGDMRRPTLHRYFDAPNVNGLSTVLGGKRSVKGALVRTELPTLRLLPSGPMPQRPAELLDGSRLGEVLNELRSEADVVILDSPPLAAGADSLVFAAQTDLTIVVVRHDVAKAAGTQATVAAFTRAGAGNIAMVLNAAENDPDAGYYGYYSSHYTADVSPEPVLELAELSANGNDNGNGKSASRTGARKSEAAPSAKKEFVAPTTARDKPQNGRVVAPVQAEPVQESPVAEFEQEEPAQESPVAEFEQEEPAQESPVAELEQEEPVQESPVAELEQERPVATSAAAPKLKSAGSRARRLRATVAQAQEDPLAMSGTER
jgi:tyrosine-protein kinase